MFQKSVHELLRSKRKKATEVQIPTNIQINSIHVSESSLPGVAFEFSPKNLQLVSEKHWNIATGLTRLLKKLFGIHQDGKWHFRMINYQEIEELYKSLYLRKASRPRWSVYPHRSHNYRLIKLVWKETLHGQRPLDKPILWCE